MVVDMTMPAGRFILQIFIPTIGRAEEAQQITYKNLKDCGTPITLVVDEKSSTDGSWEFVKPPHRVVVCPYQGEGNVGCVRQWILDNTTANKILIFDDDLTISFRTTNVKFEVASTAERKQLIQLLDDKLEQFAHMGIHMRFRANFSPLEGLFNCRYYTFVAFNRALFPDTHPRYRLRIYEDYDFNLQLLTAGCGSHVITTFAVDDRGRKPGGCNTYRTGAIELEEAKKLRDLWPDLVRLKGVKPTIQWKKAAKIGGLV